MEPDILADPRRRPAGAPTVPATPGLVAEDRASGFAGAVVAVDRHSVTLRDRHGRDRLFRLQPGAFAVAGRTVTLVAPPPARERARPPARTASGSVPVPGARARRAAASRIWVEGVHDAELVEKVWGDDLRVEGVVVERLDGIDHLSAHVERFGPGPGRRLGVLVDHLVPGSKEDRLAREVRHPHVLVTGTPFVDVWQAVRPAVAGLASWPVVPPGQPWKEGVCRALGEPQPGALWRRLLGSVRTYADLEPALVGAVERLIDFVTET